MDLFDYCHYESDSFSDSAPPPPDFRVQRTPCCKALEAGGGFARGMQENYRFKRASLKLHLSNLMKTNRDMYL